MDITFNCNSISVSATIKGKAVTGEVTVEVGGADEGDILNEFKLKDIVRHFGEDELLDQIGAKAAMNYFGLQEKTDE